MEEENEELPKPPAGMEEFRLSDGSILHVHAKERCKYACPIHAPSDHPMREFPLQWRSDRSIFERVCPHGVGHPDPDTMNFIKLTSGEYWSELEGVHGCDGCCGEKPQKKDISN